MTFRQVVTVMLRRWYVPVALILCAVGATMVLARNGGLYSTRTVVYFVHLQPNRVAIGPQNGTEDEGLIAFAGAVAAEINNGRPVTRYAWDEAPLYGAGMRQGVLVGLADVGGQWTTSYTRAEIVIQVVGPSREWVFDTQQQLIQKAFDKSKELQGMAYDDVDQRVQAEVSPMTTQIDHIAASRIEVIAAYGAIVMAALLLSAWEALLLDRRLAAHGASKRPKRHDRGRNSQ